MDDLRKLCLSTLLVMLVVAGSQIPAAELEYISPEQTKALADQFASARLTDEQQEILKSKTAWTCDMFGVRTRLQVQHGIKLYNLNRAGTSQWRNSGAQPVADYRSRSGALVGKTSRLEDEIRFTSDGKLISRLSVTQPQPAVIAYSVCNSL